jgi:hypothetical protein
MDTLKEWLAGPLAVTVLTGVPADPEPDILAACKYLGMSREEVGLWLCLAKPELKEDFSNPAVVEEIVDSAREYANTIFGNDFCIEWGIKRYGLGIAESEKAGTGRAVEKAQPHRPCRQLGSRIQEVPRMEEATLGQVEVAHYGGAPLPARSQFSRHSLPL